MISITLLGLLTGCGTGILFMVIALPMWKKKIKQNIFYGFKMKYTLMDEEIWYEVNSLAGKYLFYTGMVLTLFSLPSILIQSVLFATLYLFILLAVLFTGIGVTTFKGYRLMIQLAEDKNLKK
jgi:uncharacterized membrane protein